MAFTYVVNDRDYTSQRIVRGYYTNTAGDTGGTITTGLKLVKSVKLTSNAAAVGNAPCINNTVDANGLIQTGDIVIVTTANDVGFFEAVGI